MHNCRISRLVFIITWIRKQIVDFFNTCQWHSVLHSCRSYYIDVKGRSQMYFLQNFELFLPQHVDINLISMYYILVIVFDSITFELKWPCFHWIYILGMFLIMILSSVCITRYCRYTIWFCNYLEDRMILCT